MDKYRLRPKPGVIRSSKYYNTKVTPIILNNNVNKNKQVKIQPKKPIIQRTVRRAIAKKTIVNQRGVRPSPLRRQKDLEMAKYKNAIINLRNSGVGRLLIMVACGPSILEVDLPKLKGHKVIDFMSINKPDPRLHPTKYWVFCDQSQFDRNKTTFLNYDGILINAMSVRARHKNQILIRNRSGKGFSKDLLQGYFIGRSTTYANMQTAYWMNYDKIFIFGCDMCKPPNSDKLHFYGVNQDVNPTIRMKRFAAEADHYSIGAKQLSPDERKRFVFCSSYNPWPFVDEFSRMDHLEAVDHILSLANSMI